MRRMVALWTVAAGFLSSVGLSEVVAQPVTKPVVNILDLEINELRPRGNKLVARTSVTLDIAGREVEGELKVPIRVIGMPGAEGNCDVLCLSVGPRAFELEGLIAELDNCLQEPVVVDIQPFDDLNDENTLICSIAERLVAGEELNDIWDDLDEEDFALFEETIRDVLNEVLDTLLEEGTPVGEGELSTNNHNRGECDILILAIPEGIEFESSGLEVQTSSLCLDIYAEDGDKNPLGQLLCRLNRRLDEKADEERIQRVVDKIHQLLDDLGV